MQIVVAVILTVLTILAFRKGGNLRHGADSWNVLAIVLYVAAYAMWVKASLTLAKARGYRRDTIGVLFAVCFIVGFCIPILPPLFPFFILFGLDDKVKDRLRRR